MSDNFSVSAIVVNYNSGQWLEKCISALLNSTYPLKEIIVVDNNSTDDSWKFISSLKNIHKNIFLHNMNKNLGYSEGNNYGVSKSSSDLVFILNPDAIIEPNTIKTLVTNLETLKNMRTSIIAPQLYNLNGTHQVSYWNFPNLLDIIFEVCFLNYLLKIFKIKSIIKKNKGIIECDAVSGASMMMFKERFLKLKGFDKTLFWMDDIDLCYRNKKNNGKNIIVLDAKVFHYIGGSSSSNYDKVIANQIVSKLKFFKKHKSPIYVLIVAIFLIIQCISRLIIFALLSIFNQKFLLKLKGYYLAIKGCYKFLIKNDDKIFT